MSDRIRGRGWGRGERRGRCCPAGARWPKRNKGGGGHEVPVFNRLASRVLFIVNDTKFGP